MEPSQPPKTQNTSSLAASSYGPEQRARIVREVLEEQKSPADLGKKYGISGHAIRDWVKKAGHMLPKSYRWGSTHQASLKLA